VSTVATPRQSLKAPGLFAKVKRISPLFLATVILPTAISIAYYAVIASDVYVSESRFVVRSADRQATTPLGMILSGTGLSRSQDDSYTVQDFILSRDALRRLQVTTGIDKSFSSHDVDVFDRFAGVAPDSSFEALFRYYRNKVSVEIDSSSSITTLTTRAFTAQDSRQINEHLLEMSEELVNQLNARARQDMIQFATTQVEAAEKKATAAALALSSYRNEKGVIDPERQSTIQLQQIARLQDELVESKAALNQLVLLAKDNPQIASLKSRISTLEGEISAESNRVAGGDRSLADKAAEYERLSLERDFASKQLSVALASLEQAHNDAQRKQLYIERIVQPSSPDIAVEPKRLRGIAATLIVGLVAWGVLTILIAGIKEHRD
jgi:capsular polysaccharide transport system permease protein